MEQMMTLQLKDFLNRLDDGQIAAVIGVNEALAAAGLPSYREVVEALSRSNAALFVANGDAAGLAATIIDDGRAVLARLMD